MEYPVLVERRDGLWRAFIPALGDLAAEGASRDEAVGNARRAAEEFLSKFEITTIEVNPSRSASSAVIMSTVKQISMVLPSPFRRASL